MPRHASPRSLSILSIQCIVNTLQTIPKHLAPQPLPARLATACIYLGFKQLQWSVFLSEVNALPSVYKQHLLDIYLSLRHQLQINHFSSLLDPNLDHMVLPAEKFKDKSAAVKATSVCKKLRRFELVEFEDKASIIMSALKNMTALVSLTLSRTSADDTVLKIVGNNMRNLEVLVIDHTNITIEGLSHLIPTGETGCPHLEHLDIRVNKNLEFTDSLAFLSFVQNFPRLHRVYHHLVKKLVRRLSDQKLPTTTGKPLCLTHIDAPDGMSLPTLKATIDVLSDCLMDIRITDSQVPVSSMSDGCIGSILSQAKSLRCLEVNNLAYTVALNTLLLSPQQCLQVLKISCYHKDIGATNHRNIEETMHLVLEHCKQLEVLEFEVLLFVPIAATTILDPTTSLSLLRSLVSVQLTGLHSHHISNWTMKSLLSGPSLRKINLHNCQNVTAGLMDDVFTAASVHNCCSERVLDELHLTSCQGVTTRCLMTLLDEENVPKMLKLKDCRNVTFDLLHNKVISENLDVLLSVP